MYKYDGLEEFLFDFIYPGRGIMLGMSEDGLRSVVVYFIMGRSENSRNRVFERTPDGIRTKAYDPAKLTDPSLIIYNPVRVFDGRTIVTNGDQTDTIRDFLISGRSFHDALLTREFEPDEPNYTPRISGLLERDGSYKLSILKSADGDPASCERQFFDYSNPLPGIGHFISTYAAHSGYDNSGPLSSFEGVPLTMKISIAKGIEDFALSIWYALNKDNRVSLYAREIDIASGEKKADVIINERVNTPAYKQISLPPEEDS